MPRTPEAPEKCRAFISYARSDGEDLAAVLRRRLERDHPDITLWQDRTRLEGGIGWWRQITDALTEVEFLVLVMTPAAMVSSTARKEWRYARQQGVTVYPVMSGSAGDLDFHSLPRWMRKAHFFDLDKEWETFVNYLNSPGRAERVPFMAPDLPEGYVERTGLMAVLCQEILVSDDRDAVAVTTSLRGAGGLGKTTIAAGVCHRDEVIDAFDDGILWVTLGEHPDLQHGLAKLYASLTGERPGFVDVEDAAVHLAERLEDKNCLIVLDDVWDSAHLSPFLRGGKGCARLITTRNLDVSAGMRRIEVDEMEREEAVQMLTARLDLALDASTVDRQRFVDLSERLDCWPLLLELAGSTLGHRIARGDTLGGALDYLDRKLQKQGVVAFDHHNPSSRNQAIAATIEVSLDHLDADERSHFHLLAVFPEDTSIPLDMLSALWELDEFDCEELVQRVESLSLLKFDLRQARVRLHDVIRSYLVDQLGDAASLQASFVDRLGDPHELSSEYAWRRLAYHLLAAGREAELRDLLLDFDWLQRKLDAVDVVGPILDCELLPHDDDIRMLRGVLQLAAHVLARDKTQLASQLLARMPASESPALDTLRDHASLWQGSPWFRPRVPTLTTPGGPLLSTHSGHRGRVRSVVVTPDGGRAVSASDDNTLRVWRLDRGGVEKTLEGHQDWVRAVAVAADGRIAVSGSDDHTIRVWDLETGQCEIAIDTYSDWIRAVCLTPDGRRIVSASDDRSLRVWDRETGRQVGRLDGHGAKVTALAVDPHEGRLVSASDDRTLRVWDLDRCSEIRVMKGHKAKVTAVALSSDGRRAISASMDDTLRVWELQGDDDARTLSSEAYWVRALAVTPDDRFVIGASEDRRLRIWDLESGHELATLEGHTDWVNAVAVTPDGERCLSASDDHTLKMWSLEAAGAARERAGHADRVRAIAVTPDGRVLSTSEDRTLRIWRADDSKLLDTIPGTNHWGVVPTPDGRRVITASSDATIRVWDLESREESLVFRGHTDRIRALVALPDGRRVVSAADDRTIRVWSLADASEQLCLPTGGHWVRALAATPDGRQLVSASDARSLYVWSLETGRTTAELSGHRARVNAVAVTPDGRRAVSGSHDHTVRIWDLSNAREERVLRGHTGWVHGIGISTDGRHIYSASRDGTLRGWWLESGDPIATFTGESPFLACGVVPGEGPLVVGDQLGTLHFLEPRSFDPKLD